MQVIVLCYLGSRGLAYDTVSPTELLVSICTLPRIVLVFALGSKRLYMSVLFFFHISSNANHDQLFLS